MTVDVDAESKRILSEYDRREREIPADHYSMHHPRNLFIHQEHERMLLHCLRRAGQVPLDNKRVLEVGCGHGNWLNVFERLGARRENMAGIELGADRADYTARRMAPADVRSGDASKLPWADQSFDIVFQRMVFSSILDPQMRRAVAAEMMRVARPAGTILWIDFFINPRNPQVCCLGKSDVRALFPGWRATFYRTTLAPPLSARLVNVSWSLARALEKLKLLNTFYFGILARAS